MERNVFIDMKLENLPAPRRQRADSHVEKAGFAFIIQTFVGGRIRGRRFDQIVAELDIARFGPAAAHEIARQISGDCFQERWRIIDSLRLFQPDDPDEGLLKKIRRVGRADLSREVAEKVSLAGKENLTKRISFPNGSTRLRAAR